MASINHIRTCVFSAPQKPRYRLELWEVTQLSSATSRCLGYRLTQYADGLSATGTPKRYKRVLFEGEDFGPSPLHGDDSDATVRSLMTFLTLVPGDTDDSYFEDYTPDQLDFVSNGDAQDLEQMVYLRFGDDC